MRGLVARLMGEDFVGTQRLWVEGHLRLLVVLREVFGNDLDKVVILAVIGQQMLADPALQGRGLDQVGTVLPPIEPHRLTNIGSIATATGIPRESVRRKVEELIAADWLARSPSGQLSVSPRGASDLHPSTLTAIDMLDSVFAQFIGMLNARGWVDVRHPVAPPGTET
jgi:hypothetical protein